MVAGGWDRMGGGLSMPSGSALLLDASGSSPSLSGAPAGDTNNVDTWGTATQSTTANQPFLDAYNLGGGRALVFGGGPPQAFGSAGGGPTTSQPSWLNIPSFAMTLPFTLVMVCRVDGGQPGHVGTTVLVELSTNVASARGVIVRSGITPSISVNGPSGILNADCPEALSWGAQWLEDNLARLLIIKCDGTTLTLSINGVSHSLTVTGAAPGTGAIPTSGTIGTDHANANATIGAFGMLAVYPRLTSAAEDAAILAYARARWRLADRTTATQQFAMVNAGDSIMQYNFYGNYPGRVAANLGAVYFSAASLTDPSKFCGDTANSGATLGPGANQILANYNTNGVFYRTNGLRWIVWDEGGTNDIQAAAPSDLPTATSTAATLLSEMQALVAQQISDYTAVTGGPHLILVQTITYGVALNNPPAHPFQETCRQLTNAAFRTAFANNSGGTAYVKTDVLDLDQDLVQSGVFHVAYPNNYFDDTLHPSFAGIQRMSALGILALIRNGVAA